MKNFGLRQQPCGVLALTESSADTRPPIFTTCGFRQEIQNPVAGGSRDSYVCQLMISLPGRIVLNAEL